MKRIFTSALLLAAITGCTSTAKIGNSTPSKIENVDFKNYKIGEINKAYVGEQILARKAYRAIVQSNVYESQQSFKLSGGLGATAINLTGNPGDTYLIEGVNEKGNEILAIPGSHLMFGVDHSGHWDSTILSSSFWTSPVGSGSAYSISPDTASFKKVESSIPLAEDGYVNHELIFTGLGANGISILYREYTFENRARSAFTQELVYPKDTKTIRFRNYELDLKTVTPTYLSYAVISE